jgi:hypothetical protein
LDACGARRESSPCCSNVPIAGDKPDLAAVVTFDDVLLPEAMLVYTQLPIAAMTRNRMSQFFDGQYSAIPDSRARQAVIVHSISQ